MSKGEIDIFVAPGMGYMSPIAQPLPQNQQQQPSATFFPAFQ